MQSGSVPLAAVSSHDLQHLTCLYSNIMLLGSAGGGPGVMPTAADDNKGDVDVVG